MALRRRGASLQTITAALKRSGLRAYCGARWHPASVARLVNPDLTDSREIS